MADDNSSFEPYRPPMDSPPKAALSGRTGMLTAICVAAIVLGGLGLASSAAGVLGLLVGQQLQGAFSMQAGSDGSQVIDIQRDMQAEMNAVNQRYIVFNLSFVAANSCISALLLIGGIQTLRLRPAGRRMLLNVCVAAIGFELARSVLQVFVQMEMAAVMSRYVELMVVEASNSSGPGAEFIVQAMRAMVYVGIAFAIGMVLLKLAYYAYAIRYLRKPEVSLLYQPPQV